MRAIEFKSKIKNNRILIPVKHQLELTAKEEKKVRVIVFIDDSDAYDDLTFRQAAQARFLEGYSDSDSVYDN